jgi:hypothetical protein
VGAPLEANNGNEPSSNAGTGTDLSLIHGDQTSRDGIGTAFNWLANELDSTRLRGDHSGPISELSWVGPK